MNTMNIVTKIAKISFIIRDDLLSSKFENDFERGIAFEQSRVIGVLSSILKELPDKDLQPIIQLYYPHLSIDGFKEILSIDQKYSNEITMNLNDLLKKS